MGKIALVVGPHGVGKTTLFNFAKNKNDFIVFDGIQIPADGYNLQLKEDFLAYEALYLKVINENNSAIKNSDRNGLVVRSIEESSYYFYFHKDSSVMDAYKEIYADKNNIKADCIFFLDADYKTLQRRFNNDSLRDMEETHWWYENEYARYIEYWKNYPGIVIIDTINKTTANVYDEINRLLLK